MGYHASDILKSKICMYMKKSILLPAIAICFATLSCDLFGFKDDTSTSPIKDFKWEADTLQTTTSGDLFNVYGNSVDNFWLTNPWANGGLLKIQNGKPILSSRIYFGNIALFQNNYYGGGFDDLKQLNFDNTWILKSVKSIFSIKMDTKDHQLGAIVDLASLNDRELYLLCSFQGDNFLLPSYTKIIKWDGHKGEVIYTSAWGVQGHKLFVGNNGVFFNGIMLRYTGSTILGEYDCIGGKTNSGKEIFKVGESESSSVVLGLINQEVLALLDFNLKTMNSDSLLDTNIQFPNRYGHFFGYSLDNIIFVEKQKVSAYDGQRWHSLSIPTLVEWDDWRLHIPFGLQNGIIMTITNFYPSEKFYLVKGYLSRNNTR
jgi:hypothetical protein